MEEACGGSRKKPQRNFLESDKSSTGKIIVTGLTARRQCLLHPVSQKTWQPSRTDTEISAKTSSYTLFGIGIFNSFYLILEIGQP